MELQGSLRKLNIDCELFHSEVKFKFFLKIFLIN
jgi:hypothetical protein